MRVHELAKEFGISSKELISQIRNLGQEVKTHMSVINDDLVPLLRKVHGHAATPASSNVQETHASEESGQSVRQEHKSTKQAAVVDELEEDDDLEGPGENSAVIKIRFPITVGNLAAKLKQTIPQLIKTLMGMGVFANVNQLLNEEIGFKAAQVLGIAIEKEGDEVEKLIAEHKKSENTAEFKLRPPVVTMMGHVDHGKTSLLDAIRSTNVAKGEKGQITQHMGAYGVDIPGKGHVTFLDTPGHEAFTAMRARGANVTDVVVLVVAADDGVMPQTVEAIDHAREAGCPIVVAVNKSDLPAADPQKVMMQLQKMDLTPEEWGGKTICRKVSAKTGKGIDELLEMLLLEAEVLELKANPDCPARGVVIEGHLSRGSGPVATVIVQQGTLKVGDMILCGTFTGKVRALRNHLGKQIQHAAPAYSAEVMGLNGVPEAGETFLVVEDEKTARNIAGQRILEKREREMNAHRHLSLEDLYHRISDGNLKELKLIIKADVQGSVEALDQALERVSSDKCVVRMIHGGVGGINESDVMLAAASDAIILGFHVKADSKAQAVAERECVDIRYYHIIYEAIDDVKKAMEGLLEPTYKEVGEGRVEVRRIFKSSKVGNIAGCMVLKGKISRQGSIRLVRDNVVLYEGKLGALKRFKDDVREVAEGYECGISIDGFNDIQESDIIESYRIEKIAQKL
ncbi:MAG: translation initiation factor IF-2 [Candidatus Omnitrophica bacterium]|nr:translation initiation factor IF-2 [Candidatus Omnitrophota bacterium]